MGVLQFHRLRFVAIVAGSLPVVWTTIPQTGLLRFPPTVLHRRGALTASGLILDIDVPAPADFVEAGCDSRNREAPTAAVSGCSSSSDSASQSRDSDSSNSD